ncbi:MAG TPA: acyltransferase [Spongiibacteraceae bacterium]|nr:acyltransferase [Spongiibacteraceae bacterium]
MFASVLVSITLLARVIPALTADARADTQWLDGLRGIAAATVALNHAPLVVFSLLIRPTIFGYVQQDLVLFGFCGSIGVEFFFCITGMLFASKVLLAESVDWTTFFSRRLRRIVPAYFAACVWGLIVAACFTWPIKQPLGEIALALPRLFSFGLLPLPSVNGFDFIRVLGVNWTLALEWRYYLVLPIAFVLVRDLRVLAVIAIVVFAAADVLLTGHSVWIYFLSGAICAPLMHRQFGPRMRVAAYGVILLVIGVYIKHWEQYAYYGFEHWVAMTFLFIALAVARPPLLASKPFVAMGSVSYSFYLLHSMVLVAVFQFWHVYVFDVTKLSLRLFTLLACATLAVAVGLSVVSYLYIERPFMRAAKKSSGPDNLQKEIQGVDVDIHSSAVAPLPTTSFYKRK